MGDNVYITDAGSDPVPVATDELAGGVQVQIMKIGLGADGVIDILLDSGQQTGENSLPVVLPAEQIAALSPQAAITGFATEAKQDTLLTELQLKADQTETQPVSLASLPTLANVTTLGTITNVVHVDDNGGTLTVDGTVTANLSTTDNAVLDSIQTAVEIIDNAISGNEMQVDVLTMPTVTIQDGGGAITVDGTVMANTGLTQPLTDTQLRNTAVPVSVATIPSHAVTNAGTFAVQESGAALTALQLIDNMISGSEAQVDIVGALPAGTALIGKVGIDQVTANANEVVVKSGTVTANLSATDNSVLDAIQTAVEVIDNMISGSEAQVDVITMPVTHVIADSGTITAVTSITNAVAVTNADLTTLAGAVSATHIQADVLSMPTVTVNAHAVTNAGTFATQADITKVAGASVAVSNGTADTSLRVTIASDSTGQVKLAAGTAGIGKLTANDGVDIGNVDVASIAAGDNNIGNVDIVTLPALATGTNVIGKVSGAGTGYDANCLPVQVVNYHNGDAIETLHVEIDSIVGSAIVGVQGYVGVTSTPFTPVTTTDELSAIPVVIRSCGTAYDALPAGTALIGKVGIDQATANANEVVVKSGTVTAVTSITNAVTVNAHAVTNAGTFATQVDGAALTALQLIDNMISGSEAQVDIVAALPAGDNNIGNVDIVTGPTGANALQIQGTVASGSAAANNPMLNGAKAVNAEPAAVDANDVISLITDLVGKLITLPYANPENFVSGTTAAITDTTRTALIASQGGSLRTYITQLTVTNSHATVGTMVKLEDNTTTIYQAYAPPGGGFVITFPVPLKGTAATAWNVSPVTTGASVIANASGYKGL